MDLLCFYWMEEKYNTAETLTVFPAQKGVPRRVLSSGIEPYTVRQRSWTVNS